MNGRYSASVVDLHLSVSKNPVASTKVLLSMSLDSSLVVGPDLSGTQAGVHIATKGGFIKQNPHSVGMKKSLKIPGKI